MLGRAVLVLCLLTATAAAAQGYRAPRTVHGAPDLQGDWNARSLTILQRPKGFSALAASPYEAAAFETKRFQRYDSETAPTDPDAPPLEPGEVKDESAQWGEPPARLARIRGEIRSSWIVDPADGRLPYTPQAKAAAEQALKDEGIFDHPEGRPFDERCLLGGGGGVAPPIVNGGLFRIVQTRDHVVLFGEDNHDARIVRIGGRHAPAAVRPWMGDPIGWWEGETLVVETTNLSPSDGWRWNAGEWIRLSAGAKITERFTRTGPQEILYAYVVEDPATYTQAWRGEMPMRLSTTPMFETACHEGNYALTNILAGGRAQDRANTETATAP